MFFLIVSVCLYFLFNLGIGLLVLVNLKRERLPVSDTTLIKLLVFSLPAIFNDRLARWVLKEGRE